jgi:hypothetical protein
VRLLGTRPFALSDPAAHDELPQTEQQFSPFLNFGEVDCASYAVVGYGHADSLIMHLLPVNQQQQ